MVVVAAKLFYLVFIHFSLRVTSCMSHHLATNCIAEFGRRNDIVTQQSSKITTVKRGRLNTENYSVYFWADNKPISPFHDIPLFADFHKKIVNMVVEVPRWTNAKMEINREQPLNPIRQDTKNGKLRYVADCFPFHGYIWNYGALPQTWEDPGRNDSATGLAGDNDPVDVCEISSRVAETGDVLQVKILGALALMDQGETDWKLIAIDVEDPRAPLLNDISDVYTLFPGLLESTIRWFQIYKIPTGEPKNRFAFSGRPMDSTFAYELINATHNHWKDLIVGRSNAGTISIKSTTIPEAAEKLTYDEAVAVVMSTPKWKPAAKIPPKVNTWYFLDDQDNLIEQI